MKKRLPLLLSCFIILILSTAHGEGSPTDTLRIASYNVRIAVDAGTKDWANRKQYVADIIKNKYDFELFGVQELRNTTQESELMAYLAGYSRFSKGRDNTAGTSGERLAIVYKTERFQLITSGFFFLSETPNVASIGWDAKLNRICLWSKMKDKRNNQEFYFFCTHFDHVGVTARRESANLILSKMKDINAAEKLPVFLVGDLNCQPDKIPILNLIAGDLRDSRTIPAAINISGPVGTTNGWDNSPSTLTNRIDFVFVNDQVDILSYTTITNKYTDVYPSDHLPIMVLAQIITQPSAVRSTIASSGVKATMLTKNQLLLKSEMPFTYAIYNGTGSLVEAQPSSQDTEVLVPLTTQHKGVYLVKTTSEIGNSTAKILIH